jgi:hypothetical protein
MVGIISTFSFWKKGGSSFVIQAKANAIAHGYY